MSGRGRFITLEGGEGGGKSTQMQTARDLIESAGKRLVVTREPGGTHLAEEVRTLLLEPRESPMSAEAELLLVFAARAEHIAQVIEPALARGEWVLCDRFTDATYAYQGGGRGIADERIAVLEQWVQGPLRPDLTVLLDLPVALGMERVARRGGHDRFEREALDFFERIRSAYLARAAREPHRYRVVDASADVDAVAAQVRGAIAELLP